MLLYAIITINLAFVLYTIGVWSEKQQGSLKKWHLLIFWLGLIFDTVGTTLMSINESGFVFNLHGITGALAILLMLFHVVWASIVIIANNRKAQMRFHKLSLVVWLIWIIPFFTGAIMGMSA
ncbi:HsmA family protein [Bacillus sp. T3]|uniref:HsmA family protein n=1 Tax=Bacillus sp. T3 TaxID=467262 RepID=UPI002982459D|nr:HsmA family protein [Bacillus sp. T3]